MLTCQLVNIVTRVFLYSLIIDVAKVY